MIAPKICRCYAFAASKFRYVCFEMWMLYDPYFGALPCGDRQNTFEILFGNNKRGFDFGDVFEFIKESTSFNLRIFCQHIANTILKCHLKYVEDLTGIKSKTGDGVINVEITFKVELCIYR